MARDHIIPQFYLRGFLSPDPGAGGASVVWQHDTSEWKLVRPRDVEWENDYYVLRDAKGRQSSILDKRLLKPIETRVAPMLQAGGLLDDRREPNAEERAELAVFVALMQLRLPHVHQTVEEFYRANLETWLTVQRSMWQQNPDSFRRSLEEYKAATGDDRVDGLDVDDLMELEFEVNVPRAEAIASVVSSVSTLARLIDAMPWSFWVTAEHSNFITSNNPMCRAIYAPWGHHGFFSPELNGDDIDFMIPLTKRVCLVGHLQPHAQNRGFVDIDDTKAAAVNTEVWLRSTRRYAPTRNFTGRKYINDWETRRSALMEPLSSVGGAAQSLAMQAINSVNRDLQPDADFMQQWTAGASLLPLADLNGLVQCLQLLRDSLVGSDRAAVASAWLQLSLRVRQDKANGDKSR